MKAADGYHLWSESYDRELTGIFAVQEEIAKAVVEALKLQLLPGQAPATRHYETSSEEAHNELLLGDELIRRGTLDAARRALKSYEKALALDPRYALAQARLASATHYIYAYGTDYSAAEVVTLQE